VSRVVADDGAARLPCDDLYSCGGSIAAESLAGRVRCSEAIEAVGEPLPTGEHLCPTDPLVVAVSEDVHDSFIFGRSGDFVSLLGCLHTPRSTGA